MLKYVGNKNDTTIIVSISNGLLKCTTLQSITFMIYIEIVISLWTFS